MGNRDANIDLLFRDGLKDYEALPPSDVWEGINPVVTKPARSFIFLRIAASVVILIASGLLTAILIRNNPSGQGNPPLSLVNRPELNQVLRESLNSPIQTGVNQLIAQVDNSQVVNMEIKSPESETSLFSLPSPGLFTSFTEKVEKNSPSPGNRRSGKPDPLPKAYNPSFSDPKKDAGVQVKENLPARDNRWSVGAMVSPAYYSRVNLSKDDAATDIIKSEDAAFSYTGGLNFAYNLNRRLTVQAGISYSSIGQKIDGVTSYSGFGKYAESKGGSDFEVMTSSGTISTVNSDIYLSDNNSGARVVSMFTREVFDPVKNNLSYISSNLNQNFNYLEVPVVIKYKIIDRSVDLKVIGGVSYNILVNNSAYTTAGGTKYYIGKTEGLSPVTLSSSLGMGMEYSFSGRLSLNLEPTLRYYITPLGGLAGSSIHPYSFAILSGVSYKF